MSLAAYCAMAKTIKFGLLMENWSSSWTLQSKQTVVPIECNFLPYMPWGSSPSAPSSLTDCIVTVVSHGACVFPYMIHRVTVVMRVTLWASQKALDLGALFFVLLTRSWGVLAREGKASSLCWHHPAPRCLYFCVLLFGQDRVNFFWSSHEAPEPGPMWPCLSCYCHHQGWRYRTLTSEMKVSVTCSPGKAGVQGVRCSLFWGHAVLSQLMSIFCL